MRPGGVSLSLVPQPALPQVPARPGPSLARTPADVLAAGAVLLAHFHPARRTAETRPPPAETLLYAALPSFGGGHPAISARSTLPRWAGGDGGRAAHLDA